MKVVSGSITSSKRISLSKAAQTLSKFISTENGASQAVSAYLKRASSSFNELIQFHNDLESGKLDRTKNKKSRILLERSLVVSHGEEAGLEGQIRNFDEERGGLDDGGRNSERKKKKRRELLDERGIEREDELDYSNEKREKKKKRREILDDRGVEEGERKEKKRKKIEIEDELDDSNEKHKKKKKRIKNE